MLAVTGPGSTHCWGSPRRVSPACRPGPSRGARNWSTPGTHTRRQPVLSSLLGLNREAPDEAESAANLLSLRRRRWTESKRTCVGHAAGDWGTGGRAGRSGPGHRAPLPGQAASAPLSTRLGPSVPGTCRCPSRPIPRPPGHAPSKTIGSPPGSCFGASGRRARAPVSVATRAGEGARRTPCSRALL